MQSSNDYVLIINGRFKIDPPCLIPPCLIFPVVGAEGGGGEAGFIVEVADGALGEAVAHGHRLRDAGRRDYYLIAVNYGVSPNELALSA